MYILQSLGKITNNIEDTVNIEYRESANLKMEKSTTIEILIRLTSTNYYEHQKTKNNRLKMFHLSVPFIYLHLQREMKTA